MNENKEGKKAIVTTLIVSAVFLLLSAGMMVYTFVFATKNEVKPEPVEPKPVIQTAAEETSEQEEQLPPRIRSFGGTLEWYDGGKWVDFKEIKKLKESDPILAALLNRSQTHAGQEEEIDEEEPEKLIKTLSGQVAEEKKPSTTSQKPSEPSSNQSSGGGGSGGGSGGGGGGGGSAPAPPPAPAGPTSGDGQDTDASGL